jgi:soluble lytic murein transglycosylase
MIQKIPSQILLMFIVFSVSIFGQNAAAIHSPDEILKEWSSQSSEEQSYKKFFQALKNSDAEGFWDLYTSLAKKKKLLKLQHESIKQIVALDLKSEKSVTKNFKNFSKVAKKMLKNLRSQPEGVEYELSYLKWIQKNNNTREVCTTERTRWLSQISLSLGEVSKGLRSCPLTYNDFIYRIRMAIFSGEEKKAQDEINEFVSDRKSGEWERAYLQAVFFSNVGDPTSAFDIVIKHEAAIKKNEDYFVNLFYIAQRAGQQQKAEAIINEILKHTRSSKKLNDYKFQKAFLFYQTKRYKEALALLEPLIKSHRSHKRKKKSNEYDDLTWLRAWCQYLNKDYEKAVKSFNENKAWARDKAKNLYWLAQAEYAQGNQLVALEYYRQLARPVLDGKFFNYYNYLAWLRFDSYKSNATSDFIRSQLIAMKSGRGLFVLPDYSTNVKKLQASYQSYYDEVMTTDEGALQIINQENASEDTAEAGIQPLSSKELKAELAWADELTKWGYRDMAKWHLYEVEKNLKSKLDVAPLVQYYLEKHHYNRAIMLMQKVGSLTTKKLSLTEEEMLWKSIFPKAYENAIETHAKKQQIQRFLIWSIMKAETQFKTDAISPVGAVGLMQFMPYTSKKVAVILGEDLQNNHLFDSNVAIKYGATYLKKLSNELGSQLPLIAAAYNGGPHRVKLWLKNFREADNSNLENDVFIEHIPFNETRTYVKRVINFYLAYQKLYDDKADLRTSKWLIEKNPYKLKEPFSLKEEWPL